MLSAVVWGIVGSLIASMIFAEVTGWSPRIARRIVKKASRWLPSETRSEMLEEWLAYLEELPTPLSQLAASISFIFAAGRLGAVGSRFVIASGTRIFAFVSLVVVAPMLIILTIGLAIETGTFPLRRRWVRVNGQQVRGFILQTAKGPKRSQQGARIGRIGKFARRTDMDGLPILLNFVTGEAVLGRRHFRNLWQALTRRD